MINRNLDAFNLHFPVHCLGEGELGMILYISDPSNLTDGVEVVDLSPWGVDNVQSVSLGYDEEYAFKLNFFFDSESRKLNIIWKLLHLATFEPRHSTLTIRFYSLSQQREKALNNLFS